MAGRWIDFIYHLSKTNQGSMSGLWFIELCEPQSVSLYGIVSGSSITRWLQSCSRGGKARGLLARGASRGRYQSNAQHAFAPGVALLGCFGGGMVNVPAPSRANHKRPMRAGKSRCEAAFDAIKARSYR